MQQNNKAIKRLVTLIKLAIPDNVKILYYLMNLLSLGREAVYRRLRGEVIFNMDELIKISNDLNISLDDIINHQKKDAKNASFETKMIISDNLENTFKKVAESYIELHKVARQSTNAKLIIASNMIPFQLFLEYKTLAKVASYKWLYQTKAIEHKLPFSEYKISDEIANLVHEFIKESKTIDTEYIFDCNTFTSYIKDIVFFSKLKLITKPEVILLKKDLLDLINNLETKAAKGSLGTSSKISVYISSINIESSCSLIKSDNSQIAHFRIYGIGGITSFDTQLLEVHQIWIESMKRYSILITGSADLIRKEYFNEQRKAVEIMLGEDTTSDD